MRSGVRQRKGHAPAHRLGHRGRDHRAARLGEALQRGGAVDAVPQQIAALDDHVPQVHASAEADSPVVRFARAARLDRLLERGGAAHGFHSGGELGQEGVAQQLEHAPMVRRDGRLHDVAEQRAQPPRGALFVGPDQRRE
jgi:hypothetical protein